MISPTGLGIRVDGEGDGHYGASRGARRHNGIDYICEPGQAIKAPFNMFLKRISYPNSDLIMQGVAWQSGSSTGKMFYFKPDKNLIGKAVKEGDVIGYAQSVAEDYGLPGMINHIHLQIDK